jgi:hypothetical protein
MVDVAASAEKAKDVYNNVFSGNHSFRIDAMVA